MPTMNGAFVIDKPAAMTSHDVVRRVRQIIDERKVGHTGTLDPFATGVLIVLVGRATRLAQFLSGAEKEYEAVIRLGYATDTGDVTGTRLETEVHAKTTSAESLRMEEIEAALASLRGEIEQVPPMYSAKKIAGRKLYEHARRGEEIERQPVRVTIHEFELLLQSDQFVRMNEDGSADLRARVVCSAGTYVRTLAEDLGRKLGTGAHLTALRRTRAGCFSIESAITLEQLAELAKANSVEDEIVTLDATIGHLPSIVMNESDVHRVTNGRDIEFYSEHQNQQRLRLQNLAGELVAVGVYDAERGRIHPQVVLGEQSR